MATKPECPYCGRTIGLRQVHEGCGSIPAEYTCEGCFTATDTGPCFDDLPLAPITMTPREAGEAAFYECEGNNAACLKAAFDAYEAAALGREENAQRILARVRKVRDGYADQAKFADLEPASYFREFIRRLDEACEATREPKWGGQSSSKAKEA